MEQAEWSCKNCGAINELIVENCWNCKITRSQNSTILSKHEIQKFAQEESLKRELDIKLIPVVSINPINLIPTGDFKIKGFVTSQVIKSTGLLFGISGGLGSFALDLYTTKSTVVGEREVFQTLREKAYVLGANAIVGVDVDYADTGGFKTLLISAQGTAVWIKDVDLYFDRALPKI